MVAGVSSMVVTYCILFCALTHPFHKKHTDATFNLDEQCVPSCYNDNIENIYNNNCTFAYSVISFLNETDPFINPGNYLKDLDYVCS